ncbi:hypothetical protein [Streptomyces sp. NBC_01803]|uniref:hypothetical protein n=1 Tax=Streptomyces sp. NBC_01803 TaxID=2975946 RepID=UPI002DDC2CA6|nr:hypothetical protein [Streptomyces sp. NBC_01803]WSA45115.1 hypothetical protein OIE51_13410 [Streptomyces sp. NBC_01803]
MSSNTEAPGTVLVVPLSTQPEQEDDWGAVADAADRLQAALTRRRHRTADRLARRPETLRAAFLLRYADLNALEGRLRHAFFEHDRGVLMLARLLRTLYAAALDRTPLQELLEPADQKQREAAYAALLRHPPPPPPPPTLRALTTCVLTAAPPLAGAGQVAATTP